MNDIRKYIEKISPKAFEELCVKYLKKVKGKNYIVRGTRYLKDGGKDIVGFAKNDIPYEVWAECKKHSRSIGLDEISKNVVLVLSKGINELIFFSTSDITPVAKKHISNVSAKYNFSVGFCYGDNLYNELESIVFSTKKTFHRTNCENYLSVISFLSEYEEPERYEETSSIILNRDTVFYIDVYLKNKTHKLISDIKFSISHSNNMEFSIKEYDNDFNISPLCDRIVQIKVNVLNCKENCVISPILIQYKYEDKLQQTTLNPGTVNPTGLIHFPIVSQRTNIFLKQVMEPNLRNPQNKFLVIDIKGGSGVGKTRVIDEIKLLADFNDWNVVHYDGKYIKNFRIIKDMLCNFIGIPYFTGNINFTAKEIRDILRLRGNNADFATYIYDFVYKDVITSEILYYIKDAFFYFLKQPYLDYHNLLIIDNFQELETQVIDFIKDIIYKGITVPAKFVLAISTNTEQIKPEMKPILSDFFDYIIDIPEANKYLYSMGPLEDNEAKLLFIHSLKNLEYYDNFVDLLVHKTGNIPFDIIMQIKYLHEENIVSWNNSQWYITNFDKFDLFINNIPDKSKNLLKKRIHNQKHLFGNNEQSTEYWNTFKLLVKCILFFRGSVPITFINYIKVDEYIISELMDSLFFKYDKEKPNISFYHDNIFRYFSDIKIYNHDAAIADKILRWFELHRNQNIESQDDIIFHCLIDLRRYADAKEIGFEILESKLNIKDYNSMINISNYLLEDNNFNLSKQDEFNIKLYKAEAHRERIDHETGAAEYYELFKLLESGQISMNELTMCKFLKNAINACLNSDKLQHALEVLNYFKSGITTDPYYKFIIFDRFAVVYLGLGNIELSKENIDIAVALAEKSGHDKWRSIAYSDYAYLYYRGYQNKELTKKYFNKAYEVQFSKLDYLNRKAELLQQKAFCDIIDSSNQSARLNINTCISLCDDIKNTYLKGKALNLKGIIEIYDENYNEALHSWGDTIELCQEIKNMPCQIRAYINIGAYFFASNRLTEAINHLELALTLFRKSEFCAAHFRELFINLIRIYYMKDKTEEINKIISECSLPDIFEFYNFLNRSSNAHCEYGILFYNGANYIF